MATAEIDPGEHDEQAGTEPHTGTGSGDDTGPELSELLAPHLWSLPLAGIALIFARLITLPFQFAPHLLLGSEVVQLLGILLGANKLLGSRIWERAGRATRDRLERASPATAPRAPVEAGRAVDRAVLRVLQVLMLMLVTSAAFSAILGTDHALVEYIVLLPLTLAGLRWGVAVVWRIWRYYLVMARHGARVALWVVAKIRPAPLVTFSHVGERLSRSDAAGALAGGLLVVGALMQIAATGRWH